MIEQSFSVWPTEHAGPKPGRGGERTPIAIWDLVQWAFQREYASIEFEGAEPINVRPECSPIYTLMKRGDLGGVKIDGGGRSDPHPDAIVVAETISRLPIARGGKQMALRIADLARVGTVPDFMPEARPKIVPVEWRKCKHGMRAKIDIHHVERWLSRGRIIERAVTYCKVRYAPSADEIARARRDYLRWWDALFDLRTEFLFGGGLQSFRVTDDLPPMMPWKETS